MAIDRRILEYWLAGETSKRSPYSSQSLTEAPTRSFSPELFGTARGMAVASSGGRQGSSIASTMPYRLLSGETMPIPTGEYSQAVTPAEATPSRLFREPVAPGVRTGEQIYFGRLSPAEAMRQRRIMESPSENTAAARVIRAGISTAGEKYRQAQAKADVEAARKHELDLARTQYVQPAEIRAQGELTQAMTNAKSALDVANVTATADKYATDQKAEEAALEDKFKREGRTIENMQKEKELSDARMMKILDIASALKIAKDKGDSDTSAKLMDAVGKLFAEVAKGQIGETADIGKAEGTLAAGVEELRKIAGGSAGPTGQPSGQSALLPGETGAPAPAPAPSGQQPAAEPLVDTNKNGVIEGGERTAALGRLEAIRVALWSGLGPNGEPVTKEKGKRLLEVANRIDKSLKLGMDIKKWQQQFETRTS